MKTAAAVGVARKLYTEARKPHNQARIKAAADRVRSKRRRSR